MGFLLSLLKFAKLAPILKAAAFMALSVGVYALAFGWQFALGFVLLILVHEMGHYVAARRLGMDVGLPTFIPFVGAWIELKDEPLTEIDATCLLLPIQRHKERQLDDAHGIYSRPHSDTTEIWHTISNPPTTQC